MTFGKRLAQLRSRMGISQYELAARLQLTRGQIANYEQGTREPDFRTVQLFADFFNVTVDYLVRGAEAGQPAGSIDAPEEREFLKWIREKVSGTFFYDFDAAPEESKAQLMRDLRYMWERDKHMQKSKKPTQVKEELEEW